MPKTTKKEVFECQYDGCNVLTESYDDLEAHAKEYHVSVYEKCNRGDYVTKLPYVQYSKDQAAYNTRQEDQHRLNQQFKRDLEVEHDVVDNPKRDMLYSIAWEQGHSYGYNDVAIAYNTLVPLIK